MNPEKAKYLAENLELRSRTDRLWLNNPVVMQGLGLAPLVVAATTGRNALILAMAVPASDPHPPGGGPCWAVCCPGVFPSFTMRVWPVCCISPSIMPAWRYSGWASVRWASICPFW